MKNKKGFTLVELLAVIVILAVIILIAVNAVLPQMRKARKNSFADEVRNIAKAAETKYVAESLEGGSGAAVCYNFQTDLKGAYVSKNDSSYVGVVVVSADANDNVTKLVTLNNGTYMVSNVNGSDKTFTVSDYSASAWAAIAATSLSGTVTAGTSCPSNP